MSVDFFDPNTWALAEPYEFRIYGDDHAQTWGIVDEEDYHFLIQWKWSWTTPKTPGAKRQNRPAEKRYLRRVVETQIETPYKGMPKTYINPIHGNEVRFHAPRIQQTLRMHTAIFKFHKIEPPSSEHKIIDHIDGDEKNYRKKNLRWATFTMNNSNLYGKDARDGE